MGGTFQKGQRIVFREAFLSPTDELVQPGDTGTVRAVMLPSFVSVVDDKHQRVWLAKPSEIDALPEKANSEPEEGSMGDNGWIHVDERLPDDDHDVLALVGGTEHMVAWYYRDGWYWGRDEQLPNVTHWRELPSLPEPAMPDGVLEECVRNAEEIGERNTSMGGTVFATVRIDFRIYVVVQDDSGDFAEIYLSHTPDSDSIQPGDSLWWQDRCAYWTPKDKSRHDVEIPRIDYSRNRDSARENYATSRRATR